MADLELFEIYPGHAVNVKSIIEVKRTFDTSCEILVQHGSEVRTYLTARSYPEVMQLLEGRKLSSEKKSIDSTVSRNIEQLARQNTFFAG